MRLAAKLPVCAVLALALLVPTTAQAAPAWLSPVDVSALPPFGQTLSDAEVATDGEGNAVAVWIRDKVVQAASRPAGGVWSAPVDLSTPSLANVAPRLAVGEQGHVVVTWVALVARGTSGDFDAVLRAVTRAPGGPWSAPQDLTPSGEGTLKRAGQARVAVDPQGNAVAIWYQPSAVPSAAIMTADRAAAASPSDPRGGWSDPQPISTGPNVDAPQLDVGPQGDAVAVWLGEGKVHAALRAAGDTWSTPHALGQSGGEDPAPQAAVDARGAAAAVWRAGEKTVQAASRPAGASPVAERGGWSQPADLTVAQPDPGTGDERYVDNPRVELDAEGNAVAVWAKRRVSKLTEPYTYGTAISSHIETANRPAAASATAARGGWSETQALTPLDQNQLAPRLAMNARGQAVATWLRLEGTACPSPAEPCDRYLVVAAARPAGASSDARGGWGAAQDIGEHLDDPEPGFAAVAVDGQGNAVAAWRSTSLGRAQAAGYDAAGPRLRDLAVPAGGTVGQPLSFSVSPLDVWSSVKSTRWDFGDGTGATANSASHSYRAAGTYTVTVSSTDSLDNTSTETRTVQVAGPVAADAVAADPGTGTGAGTGTGGGGAPGTLPGTTPTPTPGKLPDTTPDPGPASDAKSTAKLSLARATINRRDRVLDVLAPITSRASGSVRVELHAAGRRHRFTAPVDSRDGRIRFRQRIPKAQADVGTGIVTIAYPGDADTRPQTVRLRAAPQRADLRLARPAIAADGRLRAGGSVSKRARGVVRVQLEYVADAKTTTLQFLARIDEGRWSLDQQLSRSVRESIARRSGTVHSYTLFTGYAPARMRGEMRSFQVLGPR